MTGAYCDKYLVDCAHAPPLTDPQRSAIVRRWVDGCAALYGDTVCDGCNNRGRYTHVERYEPFDTVREWEQWRTSRRHRSDMPRVTGLSSDALVAYAVGTGPRPMTPGHPDTHHGTSWRGDQCDRNAPWDQSDLAACERTYATAPIHLRPIMEPVMVEFRAWVNDRVNRHGDRLLT